MTSPIALNAQLAIKGIREGLEAGKEVEALVKDIDNFATSEAQARAAMRRKSQVVMGDTTILNAVDEWRRLKKIYDMETELKNDVIKKYGKAEWDKVIAIKERMLKEQRDNYNEFGEDVKALRRLMFWCFVAAAIVTYFLWKFKLV
jgi:bisphosphoglycerate-dependent phosphoglycerate mutase